MIAYRGADFGGCKTDRKNTNGTCFLLGNSLVSWSCKKQNSLALPTTKAEYMAASNGCAQLLWMKQTLFDYGIKIGIVPLKCDKKTAICLSKNSVLHTRIKHIDVKHHFLRDLYTEKKNICFEYISTEDRTDILTKPLDSEAFCKIGKNMGICDISDLK